MSKDELKELVASKIAGQGTQVDLGNALPTILNEIIDQMGGGGSLTIDMKDVDWDETDHWPDEVKDAIRNAINNDTLVGATLKRGGVNPSVVVLAAYSDEDNSYFIYAAKGNYDEAELRICQLDFI